jgi:adenine C2-methylase RlmN of 23S rRNA A2503 and tRNA A37
MRMNQEFVALRSGDDASINFSRADARGGMVETRFVRRLEERFIVYISSMLGCDKACRFCHLTQTGQTNSTLLSEDEMVEQARTVLGASDFAGARTVHFNFMARGEPMSNPSVGRPLFKRLAALATEHGLKSRVKVSTILPLDVWTTNPFDLWDSNCPPVDLYYSLYSVDDDWRRRWIPKAVHPKAAMDWLVRYQSETGQRVVLHWALIDGENDDVGQARAAADLANASGLRAEFNLVRYNPANEKSQEATDERIDEYVETITTRIPGRARRIPRVGPDVMASCGMFLTDNDVNSIR